MCRAEERLSGRTGRTEHIFFAKVSSPIPSKTSPDCDNPPTCTSERGLGFNENVRPAGKEGARVFIDFGMYPESVKGEANANKLHDIGRKLGIAPSTEVRRYSRGRM
ncbi:MAG TPA: hypothetical protein DEP53_18010 [Bacteroidetes bacterium]|nr:hypothetical protein [Bacteroidota bacterium]